MIDKILFNILNMNKNLANPFFLLNLVTQLPKNQKIDNVII